MIFKLSGNRSVLYVGVPGTGKTTIVKDYFSEMRAKRDDMVNVNLDLEQLLRRMCSDQ